MKARRAEHEVGACVVGRPRATGGADWAPLVGRPTTAGEAGQATVEFVALLPLVLVVVLTAAALLAGHSASEHAGQAAQAGAMALIQGGDPRRAARQALPGGARAGAKVDVAGRRVTVSVRPRLPIEPLAASLTARATADAGPEPSP